MATLGESSKAPVVAGEPFWTAHRCMAGRDLDDDVPVDGLRDPAEGRKKLKIADFSARQSSERGAMMIERGRRPLADGCGILATFFALNRRQIAWLQLNEENSGNLEQIWLSTIYRNAVVRNR